MDEKKLVHVERIAIRWGDMDAMGHVNNTVYFRYMEQARISWFEALLQEGDQLTRHGGSEDVRGSARRLEPADVLRVDGER